MAVERRQLGPEQFGLHRPSPESFEFRQAIPYFSVSRSKRRAFESTHPDEVIKFPKAGVKTEKFFAERVAILDENGAIISNEIHISFSPAGVISYVSYDRTGRVGIWLHYEQRELLTFHMSREDSIKLMNPQEHKKTAAELQDEFVVRTAEEELGVNLRNPKTGKLREEVEIFPPDRPFLRDISTSTSFGDMLVVIIGDVPDDALPQERTISKGRFIDLETVVQQPLGDYWGIDALTSRYGILVTYISLQQKDRLQIRHARRSSKTARRTPLGEAGKGIVSGSLMEAYGREGEPSASTFWLPVRYDEQGGIALYLVENKMLLPSERSKPENLVVLKSKEVRLSEALTRHAEYIIPFNPFATGAVSSPLPQVRGDYFLARLPQTRSEIDDVLPKGMWVNEDQVLTISDLFTQMSLREASQHLNQFREG